MIRICHITSVHSPIDMRILHKEAVSLAAFGYEVILLAPGKEDFVWKGVEVKAAFPPGMSRLKRLLFGGFRIFRLALRQHADVYHLHDPELMPYGLLLSFKGKRVIYDAHEDLPVQILGKHYIPKLLRKPLAAMVRVIQRWSAARLDGIIAATDTIAATYKSKGRKVVVVKNYPLLTEFPAMGDERRIQNQVCYIGGIFRTRGVIELMRSLPSAGVRLALAGTYSPPVLREELQRMPEWQYVDEKGMLDREEVAKLLASSVAGMVTLLHEPNFLTSLPVKMFEYMAAGIPVIASDFPLWKEIIEDNDCGLCVNPADPEAIAEAIRFLVDHAERAKQMGHNGRRLVQERLNWEHEESKLLAVYQEITTAATA